MDLGSVGGFVVASLLIVVLGIGPGNIPMFIDPPSMAIVLGGTFSAIFIMYPPSKVKTIVGVLRNAIFPQSIDFVVVVKMVVSFAEQARREGILALEARLQEIDDEFLKKGIQLAVDGTEPELIKDILETEIGFIEDRHKVNYGMFDGIAALGPAYGMIGTLVGLVLMLANMSDPSAIGPAMAIALLTTFYGSLLANLIGLPFATKLKYYSDQEILLKTMMLEGIMSLQAGENPRIVEWKLSAFIDPTTRLLVSEKEGAKD
jgi:chemotaxis protein MotA